MPLEMIATWLVIDQDEDASFFPQVGVNSAQRTFQNVYWRCAACFYATSVRLNPDATHTFFTNVESLPVVDKLDLNKFFEELGVEVISLPITHRLGKNRVAAWNNQFYVLDIIRYLAKLDGFDNVIVLDSDCVWVREADEFFADIKRRGILSLSIAYASDHKVNGGSREDMRRAAEKLVDRILDFTPHYSGGEVFAATRASIIDVDHMAEGMWARLVAAAPGEIDVYEEAHFLSIIYEILDVPVGTADPHIRRMWTALRLNNVTAEDTDSSRSVWHLPMEKKTGFRDLFNLVKDRGSWVWTLPPRELRMQIARTMGLPRRTPRQWMLQVRGRMQFHALKKISELKQRGVPR